MTVNKVLSALAATGMVERRRRAGSFVSRPKVHSAVLQIPDLKVEVESRGVRYSYKLLDRQKRIATRQDKGAAGCRFAGLGPRATLPSRSRENSHLRWKTGS